MDSKLWLIPAAIVLVWLFAKVMDRVVESVLFWAITSNTRLANKLHRHRHRWYNFKRRVRAFFWGMRPHQRH